MAATKARLAAAALVCAASLMWLVFEVSRLNLPPPPTCPDERPGLWLAFADGDVRLTGRAPASARVEALSTAVDWWGYPAVRVCMDAPWGRGWSDVIRAVYRAPLSELRSGTVLVRPDLVVVAGQVRSRRASESLERTLRQNLAAAGLGALPFLYEVTVARDPALPARLAALGLRFDSASAALSADARRRIDRVVADLRDDDGIIVVTGHSDATGRASTNEAIAMARAQAVREHLERAGVPRDRVQVVGHGARLPIAGNDDEQGRAANRRVEVRIER